MARLRILLFLLAMPALAHPSVGIVVAPNGDVFYSDLVHVWRVTPSGAKQIAVPNVHSHELFIDATGAIFGEDSKWLGGDHYRHRVWRRAPNGTLSDVVPWSEGFYRSYGLTRDARGDTYWVRCTKDHVCSIEKGDGSGRSTVVARGGSFRNHINWIAAKPNGEVFVIDNPDLKLVQRDGSVRTVARLSPRLNERHDLFGITVDATGNAYVAAHTDRTVVRVSPEGRVEVVARSTAPWAPSGVALGRNNDLWILEWAGTGVRARRVPLLPQRLR